jgi:hypothetical protein
MSNRPPSPLGRSFQASLQPMRTNVADNKPLDYFTERQPLLPRYQFHRACPLAEMPLTLTSVFIEPDPGAFTNPVGMICGKF